MKIQNIYHLLQAALLMLLAASCTQEEFPAAQDKAQQLTISVTDGGYASAEDKTTRAVENGYTTEFTEGDACGLFVVRGSYQDKKMIYSNVKLTAERDAATGSLVWKPEAGTTLAGGLQDEVYYLYYPYRSDLDNTVISNLLKHAIENPQESFFKPIMNNWPVKTDQSSYADYTASDLMTASCTPTLDNGTLRLNFVMAHELSLAVIEMPKTVYKFTNARVPDYTIPSEATFASAAKPLRMTDGTYRYLLPASLPTIEGSYDGGGGNRVFTITPSDDPISGKYKRYKIDGAATTVKNYTVQRGDYLLADGNLLPRETAVTEEQKANIAAIVFWTPADTDPAGRKTPANLTDDKIMAKDHPNCTHGLAVSVKNVSTGMAWQEYDWFHGSVQKFQKSDEFNPIDKTDYASIVQSGDERNYIRGYQYTKMILAYNYYCMRIKKLNLMVKPVNTLANFSNSNPAPKTSTGWFIPSAKELYMLYSKDEDKIHKNFFPTEETRKIIDKYLLAIGGDLLENQDYWTSVEFDVGNAIFIGFKGDARIYSTGKTNKATVRAVCAF